MWRIDFVKWEYTVDIKVDISWYQNINPWFPWKEEKWRREENRKREERKRREREEICEEKRSEGKKKEETREEKRKEEEKKEKRKEIKEIRRKILFTSGKNTYVEDYKVFR